MWGSHPGMAVTVVGVRNILSFNLLFMYALAEMFALGISFAYFVQPLRSKCIFIM